VVELGGCERRLEAVGGTVCLCVAAWVVLRPVLLCQIPYYIKTIRLKRS
jgi:hypothetical protein